MSNALNMQQTLQLYAKAHEIITACKPTSASSSPLIAIYVNNWFSHALKPAARQSGAEYEKTSLAESITRALTREYQSSDMLIFSAPLSSEHSALTFLSLNEHGAAIIAGEAILYLLQSNSLAHIDSLSAQQILDEISPRIVAKLVRAASPHPSYPHDGIMHLGRLAVKAPDAARSTDS